MTSLELVDFINASRAPGEAELRHDHFMAKVPKVLGDQAPKFLGTSFYVNGAGHQVPRAIYVFPKREACLMAMSYSYELQARVFDRMTALEEQQKAPALPNFSNPGRGRPRLGPALHSPSPATSTATPSPSARTAGST